MKTRTKVLIFIIALIAVLLTVAAIEKANAQEPNAEANPTATILINWAASTTPGVGYQVFRETGPGICTATTSGAGPNCLLLNQSPLTVLTYTDTGVSTHAPVWYVVRATNQYGNSPYANEVKVTFTVTPPPSAPSALKCSGSTTDPNTFVTCQ